MNRLLYLGVLIVVIGCGEDEAKRPPPPKPPTSSIVPVDPDGAPVEFEEPGVMEKLTEWVSEVGGKVASTGWKKLFQKETATFGGSIYAWITLGLLVGGGALIWLLKWPLGTGLAVAGLILTFLKSGIDVEVGFWSALVAIWIAAWVVSRLTPFRWDNLMVFGGGMALVIVSLIVQDFTWAAYASLLLLAVEPALWREPRLTTAQRWLIMAPLLGVMLITN